MVEYVRMITLNGPYKTYLAQPETHITTTRNKHLEKTIFLFLIFYL